MADYDYDMLVIGSGPAGQRAAIQAAKLDKRVAIVERRAVVGGVCLNTGTIPSKTLREAVMHLSGYRERGVYGASYAVKQHITVDDLLFRADHVMRHEIDVTRHQLMRNQVELLYAEASFVDPHTLQVTYVDGRGQRLVTAAHVVIATGTRATSDSQHSVRQPDGLPERRYPEPGPSAAHAGGRGRGRDRSRICQHVRRAGRAGHPDR